VSPTALKSGFEGLRIVLALMIFATFNAILHFATSKTLLGGNVLSGKGNLTWEVRLQRE
jgi:hypothetical protein